MSLPAVTPRIYSSDEIQYFAFLRSAWFDRDLSFENEYRYFYDHGIARSEGFHETFLERQTATGRRLNFGTIGCAVLWSPFYAVGDVVARASGAPRDGFSTPYIASIAYGSVFYAFLALVLAIRCAGRLELDGFAAAVAVWLGTPLLFYMYIAPPFSHACSAFAVALFTYVWLRVRGSWSARGMIALGAAGALMAMTREQDAFFVFGPAVDFVWASLDGDQRSEAGGPSRLIAAAMGCVAFGLVFLPQAATYLVLNGHLGPDASVAHKMSWTAPHALQVLASPGHGFFVWTPLALLALLALAWKGLTREMDRQVALCLLLMAALQVYIGGSVESWTVAGGYGQRRFVALTTVMVIGLSSVRTGVQDRASGRLGARAVFTAALVLCVYWNMALIAEFATGLMDRQRLEPKKNAYDAFVTLPRMAPSLVYRYLFERSSFYQGPHGS
ncbi:MAG TPA: hypothetical protein VEL79_01260 [Vicinamibacterales bacterium]|nr:hypothetical protein [Vicinamibacterales bacterium]